MGPFHWRKTGWKGCVALEHVATTTAGRHLIAASCTCCLNVFACPVDICSTTSLRWRWLAIYHLLGCAGWPGSLFVPVVSTPQLALRCSYQGKLQGLATPGQRGALPHTSGWDNNGLFNFFSYFPRSFACSTNNGSECIRLTSAEIKRAASILKWNSSCNSSEMFSLIKKNGKHLLIVGFFKCYCTLGLCLNLCVCICVWLVWKSLTVVCAYKFYIYVLYILCVYLSDRPFNLWCCSPGPGGQRSSTEELERNCHRPAGHPHHLFPDCHLCYPVDPKYV